MTDPGIEPMKEVVPGAGSLVEQVDKRIFVWLRDGQMYVGILRSVDLFANLVLHRAFQRIQVGNDFGDVYQGVVVIRGENVSLLGEVKEHQGNIESEDELITHLDKKEKKREMITKLKVEAYRRRGLIYTPEDYF